MDYLIGILVAGFSFSLGVLIGIFEGKRYSFREIPYWLHFIKNQIWFKRLHFSCVIIERIFIVPLITLLFLLIVFIFWPKNGYEPFSPYLLLFFAPGFAIASTRIVIKRWYEFKKNFKNKPSQNP